VRSGGRVIRDALGRDLLRASLFEAVEDEVEAELVFAVLQKWLDSDIVPPPRWWLSLRILSGLKSTP
jgi:hypothetical protein